MGKLKGKFIVGKNLEKIIEEIGENEIAWAQPENLEIDYNYNCYLHLGGTVMPTKSIDAGYMLKIQKIGPEKEDYLVDINEVENYSWKRTDYPFDEYLLEDETDEDEIPELPIIKRIIKLDYKFKPTTPFQEKSLKDQLNDAVKSQNYELAQKLKNKIQKKALNNLLKNKKT